MFHRHGLGFGRCFGSKSAYRDSHEGSFFVPNANVFSLREGKLWWGDIDIDRDAPALEKIARALHRPLYVLHESDGRFQNAELTPKQIVSHAIWRTGGHKRVPGLRLYLRRSGLTLRQAAFLNRIRIENLTAPVAPRTYLEALRRLHEFEAAFGAIGKKLGLIPWGTWWTTPQRKLGGASPIAVLEANRTLDLQRLLGAKVPSVAFCMGMNWRRWL